MTTAFALCSLQHAVDSFEFMITFKTFIQHSGMPQGANWVPLR